MKQINGNIKAPNLRMIHWNKGCSKFINKIDDIKMILDKFRPHIFSLVEANFDLKDRLTIDNYSIETEDMKTGSKVSRTIMLIDNQIDYTRLSKYDTMGIPAVWVKLNLGSKNNPVIMSGYRQWNLLGDSIVNN